MEMYNVQVLENGNWETISTTDDKKIAEQTLNSIKNYSDKMNESKEYRIVTKFKLNED